MKPASLRCPASDAMMSSLLGRLSGSSRGGPVYETRRFRLNACHRLENGAETHDQHRHAEDVEDPLGGKAGLARDEQRKEQPDRDQDDVLNAAEQRHAEGWYVLDTVGDAERSLHGAGPKLLHRCDCVP